MTEATLTTSNGMLRFLYDFNHAAITRNCDGLTHEDSLLSPPNGGNCANWVLGHILHNRSFVLDMVKEQPLWSEAEGAVYARESKPLDPKDARPFASLLADLEETQARIRRGLEKLAPEELDLNHEEGAKRPRGAQLHFLHFHEAYHAGQLGLLRRLAGKAGAI
jgi:uncharacterized damage-inducible protein DinB